MAVGRGAKNPNGEASGHFGAKDLNKEVLGSLDRGMDRSIVSANKRKNKSLSEKLHDKKQKKLQGAKSTKLVLFGKGAEAYVFYFEAFGSKFLLKYRPPKIYRERALDEILRSKRTALESSILKKLSGRVPVPEFYFNTKYSILMSFEEGDLLSKIFKKIPNKKRAALLKNAGRFLAEMHKIGVVHGDFTPANILVTNLDKNEIKIIDFGLSKFDNSLEEKAVDVLLMKRAVGKRYFGYFFKGYKEASAEHAEVIKQLKEIESRARYVERKWLNQ